MKCKFDWVNYELLQLIKLDVECLLRITVDAVVIGFVFYFWSIYVCLQRLKKENLQ